MKHRYIRLALFGSLLAFGGCTVQEMSSFFGPDWQTHRLDGYRASIGVPADQFELTSKVQGKNSVQPTTFSQIGSPRGRNVNVLLDCEAKSIEELEEILPMAPVNAGKMVKQEWPKAEIEEFLVDGRRAIMSSAKINIAPAPRTVTDIFIQLPSPINVSMPQKNKKPPTIAKCPFLKVSSNIDDSHLVKEIAQSVHFDR